ncbi:hypothetical protein P153DRAFT_35962 [Dothidotthia symphoricarpi CBS 119687]|uniref:Uncharacterized protein n=1 Tax=Dothidotthia symphoricarpi CBS 119687 TaxID=1392245 RepID=A0A6A6A989_9PLEO|nr:uncharacterized protein P153DRAFT_35962 [Dothidotthia symphoricarpi CBS 119687]KAF2128380.1 hypothetical protein P153DRAFT_35962 [Dothidotthia symphoricarpi CBS 119687]
MPKRLASSTRHRDKGASPALRTQDDTLNHISPLHHSNKTDQLTVPGGHVFIRLPHPLHRRLDKSLLLDEPSKLDDWSQQHHLEPRQHYHVLELVDVAHKRIHHVVYLYEPLLKTAEQVVADARAHRVAGEREVVDVGLFVFVRRHGEGMENKVAVWMYVLEI